MSTEHKSVLDPCRYLSHRGFEVTYLDPEPNGLLDLNKLIAAIRSDTILISIMYVNNETGVIQDIPAIGAIAEKHGIKFHVDAVQGFGKAPINVNRFKVDLMSLSGHKVYGPKGIGVLYVRRYPRARLQPLVYGGGHEQGLRSGTLPTHQIVGMGAAFELANKLYAEEVKRISELSSRLWQGIQKLGSVTLNGDPTQRIPHCLNVTFAGVDGEALLVSLRDIAVSMGSACNSAKPEPSHVLTAYGLSSAEAHSSLRFSLGRYTTEQEIDQTIQHISEAVEKLRKISPVWEKVQNTISKQIK
jgi:cysteine desulfurase